MKVLTIMVITGMVIRFLVVTPAVPLSPFRGEVTVITEERKKPVFPEELRYMSEKMFYLKTGRKIANERNYYKQQNFWGKGIPATTVYPSHLAMWEKMRMHPIAR